MENLLECHHKIKTALQNRTRDYQLQEDLKTATRNDYITINPFIYLFLSFITYTLSLFTAFAIIIPIYFYLLYFLKHPSFSLFYLYFREGMTKNQIAVIYYQVFNNSIKLRYTFTLFIIVLISFYVFYGNSNYIVKADKLAFVLNDNQVYINLFLQNYLNDFYTILSELGSKFNNSIFPIIGKFNNKDIALIFAGFSETRVIAAYISSSIFVILSLVSIFQILKRPR